MTHATNVPHTAGTADIHTAGTADIPVTAPPASGPGAAEPAGAHGTAAGRAGTALRPDGAEAPGEAPGQTRGAAGSADGPRTTTPPAGRRCADDPRFVETTRTAYDTIARDYAAEHPDSTAGPTGHVERALLGTFAELVREHSDAPVADIGSGPGDVTARLAALGVPVFGVDVSPQMVALARESHPHLRFHVGSMTALDLPDETLAGVLALYSTIHVPDAHLPYVFAEFRRVLVPGGHVLLAFQTVPESTGERHVHLDERYGHAISLDYHWRTPETMAALLTGSGFHVLARVHREPWGEEKRPRGFVLARRH